MSEVKKSIEERVGRYDPKRPALKWPTGQVMTEGELWRTKEDPRYWRAGSVDPTYRQWVDDLFRCAYPGQNPRTP